MTLTRRSPAPNPVSAGNPCQGVAVGGQHGFAEWRDGSGNIHFQTSFGGSTSSSENYTVHHINMTTGDSHLTLGLLGQPGKSTYDPVSDRLYLGGSYRGSFGYLNPTTGAFTSIKNDFDYSLIGSMIKGDDGRIYFVEQPFKLYSYNDADGVVSYGDFSPNASESNYNALWVDSTHIYFGVIKQAQYSGAVWWTLYVGEIGDALGDFVAWEFDADGDYNLAFTRDYYTKEMLLARTLADQSTKKYYTISAGVHTEITKAANPEYAWNGAGTSIQDNYGATVFDYSPFLYGSATPPANTILGYDIDAALMAPIPTSQENSKVGYKLAAAGEYTYSQIAFTEPWQDFDTKEIVHTSGQSILALGGGYSIGSTAAYTVPTITGKGYHQTSIYGSLKAPSGLFYYSGYSDALFVYDSTAAWTLNSSNATPYAFAAENKPNPYRISFTKRYTLHYRFSLDYDDSNLIWGGGNATRTLTNPGAGEVWWYDPSDGTSGEIFDGTDGKPDWADLETYFRSLCTARSRSKIVVSANDGYIYVIDAAAKTIDGSYDLGAATGTAGDYAYMVEVADDSVMGITPSGYKFLFKPSDRTMISGPTDIGLAYTPFGWTNNSTSRMNYKLEKGPDNNGWLFMSTRLYMVDATTLAFTLIKSLSTYYKLRFIDTAGDQTDYDLLFYGNGTALWYMDSLFYTPGAGEAEPGNPLGNYREVCGSGNVSSVCGTNFSQICGVNP